jgi:carbamate kinase
MGQQVGAAARFAEQTGRAAAIGALHEAALRLDGVHGTTVTSRARRAGP